MPKIMDSIYKELQGGVRPLATPPPRNADILEKGKSARIEKIPVDQLYTVKEVGQILRISETGVRNLIKRGELHRLIIGSTKIRASEINRFLDSAEGKDFSNKILEGGAE